MPNLPCDDVPIGKDENENVEILKSGSIKKFNFKPKSHYEIGENLNMLDFDLATKTTGARFVFVKDQLALLERAISNLPKLPTEGVKPHPHGVELGQLVLVFAGYLILAYTFKTNVLYRTFVTIPGSLFIGLFGLW